MDFLQGAQGIASVARWSVGAALALAVVLVPADVAWPWAYWPPGTHAGVWEGAMPDAPAVPRLFLMAGWGAWS